MQTMPCEELVKSGAAEIIDGLRGRRLSVLESLGARRLRLEMSLVGRLCQFIVWLIYLGPRSRRALKMRAAWWVRRFFPIRYRKNDYAAAGEGTAVVVYFNHQSLFEVLATIYFCMTTFPDRRFLFPVNLPWYEGLCPVLDKLARLDVYITPMITPSTKVKLYEVSKGNAEVQAAIEAIKMRFEERFGTLVVEFLKASDLVAVAPSATRTRYVFPSYETYKGADREGLKRMPRSMEAIVMALRRERLDGVAVEFIPLVATRKRRAGRGLNVWRRHDVYVGEAETLEAMLAKQKARTLHHECYLNLAKYVPDDVKYDHAPAERASVL